MKSWAWPERAPWVRCTWDTTPSWTGASQSRFAAKATAPAGGQTRRMFLNEAQAAGALDHANILRIYDADEADGRLFIVMEYVEGGNNFKTVLSSRDAATGGNRGSNTSPSARGA